MSCIVARCRCLGKGFVRGDSIQLRRLARKRAELEGLMRYFILDPPAPHPCAAHRIFATVRGTRGPG